MALVIRFEFEENPLARIRFERQEKHRFDNVWISEEGKQVAAVKQFLESKLAIGPVYALYCYNDKPQLLSRIERVATAEELGALDAARLQPADLPPKSKGPLVWYERDYTAVHARIEQFLTPLLETNMPWTVYTFNDVEYAQFLTSNDIRYTPLQASSLIDREQLLAQLFIDEPLVEEMAEALSYKKNLIIEGPPGVGKSFVAKKLAYFRMAYKEPQFIETVQFHQTYSYDDFIQGYRPDPHGGFQLKNGVFYRFCKRAQADPAHDYYFIIDEMNRGNVSKIFGELMTLLEADKRGRAYAMPLAYSEEPFYMPDNLYVIGLMNTADRSLALVDYALRRRFAFIQLAPAFNDKFRQHLLDKEVPVVLADFIIEKMQALNTVIVDEPNLGRGFLIGHSYFTNPVGDAVKWYARIIKHEIAPLLQEYWYDEPTLATSEIEKLAYEAPHDSH